MTTWPTAIAHRSGSTLNQLFKSHLSAILPLLCTAGLAVISGCEPSCRSTCNALLECDSVESDQVTIDDCEASCEVQDKLYEDWEDQELVDAFVETKTCITSSTCEEIADGACYDDNVYAF